MAELVVKGSSKVWPTLIALLIVVLTVGTLAFFLRGSKTATVAETPVTTTTPDPVLTSAATVTSSLDDLDTDLAQIDSDLKTTDDTSPTL